MFIHKIRDYIKLTEIRARSLYRKQEQLDRLLENGLMSQIEGSLKQLELDIELDQIYLEQLIAIAEDMTSAKQKARSLHADYLKLGEADNATRANEYAQKIESVEDTLVGYSKKMYQTLEDMKTYWRAGRDEMSATNVRKQSLAGSLRSTEFEGDKVATRQILESEEVNNLFEDFANFELSGAGSEPEGE